MMKITRTHTLRKLLSLTLCLILAASVLTGCSKEKDNPSKTAVKNQKVILNEVAHSIFYAPMYVAIEKGYFKEEGIDLTLITGFGAVLLVQNDEMEIFGMGSGIL